MQQNTPQKTVPKYDRCETKAAGHLLESAYCAVTLTGRAAYDYALARGLRLNKYSDPVDGAHTDLDIDDDLVHECLAADPQLLWVTAAIVTDQ